MIDPRNVGQTSSPATRSLGNQFPRRAFRLDGYSTEFRPNLRYRTYRRVPLRKIRYRVTGDPRVHYCHCDMCRRATASAFARLAWLPSAEVSWQSEEPTYRRSPPLAQRGFCQACGPPLALAYHAAVDEIALHVGTFDNPPEPDPHYNYGFARRLSWVCCGVDLPHRNTEERW